MQPHEFQKLLDHERPSSVFAGAGLSVGIIPLPSALFLDRKNIAEQELGVSAEVPADDPEALYVWSEQLLAKLPVDGAEPPKLLLAKALGLFENPAWAGNVDFPIRGTSARHRVIARFAREELWSSLWTWNWDCVLESALEAIGFKRGEPARTQPWLTRYASIVVQDDFTKLGDRQLLCVLKPHGCVHALIDADRAWSDGEHQRATQLAERFMIGSAELSAMRDNQTDDLFFRRMDTFLSTNPAMIVGWRVSEPYLQAVVNDALSKRIKKGELEELSIIDVAFREGHAQAAKCYGLTEEQVFFQVSTEQQGFTADAFFLWLQAKLCISSMARATQNEALRAEVLTAAGLIEPPTDQRLIDWADVFIPAWCRLCWRGGLVPCAGFDKHQLDLETPDEHIPLTLKALPRPDLASAACLFAELLKSEEWDLGTFPGALWRPSELRLVVPMPAWGDLDDLASLKPWAVDQAFGMVERVEIFPLHYDVAELPVEGEVVETLRAKLARVLAAPHFADPGNIGIAHGLA